MTALRLTPVVLSLLVLAAHFLRAENTLQVVLVLAMIGFLFVKRPWSVRVVQVVPVLGAFEWLLTLSGLVVRRVELGQPYGRMVMILGSVALLTAMSALVFRSEPLRARYGLGGSDVGAAGDIESPRPEEGP
jgi:hypothetical protein